LAGSLLVSTQLPEHDVVPPLHVVPEQTPAVHVSPVGHTVPQPPQLFLSVAVMLHDWPQLTVPSTHDGVLPEVPHPTGTMARVTRRRERRKRQRIQPNKIRGSRP
jgi:hypothetical protein